MYIHVWLNKSINLHAYYFSQYLPKTNEMQIRNVKYKNTNFKILH